MENNELAIPQEMSLAPKGYVEKDVDDLVNVNDFFKRIQLMGSSSKPVKRGKVAMGHWGLVTDKDNVKDIGENVDVLVCAFRLRAMDFSDEDSIVNVYDPRNPEFARIKEMSNDKDSGCLCGLDFLLWLPYDGVFVTYYMCNKSSRIVAPELRAKIDEINNRPGPATLGTFLKETKKYSYHIPTVSDCTTPFDDNMPTPQAFIDALTKFRNPDETKVVQEESSDDSDRVR